MKILRPRCEEKLLVNFKLDAYSKWNLPLNCFVISFRVDCGMEANRKQAEV